MKSPSGISTASCSNRWATELRDKNALLFRGQDTSIEKCVACNTGKWSAESEIACVHDWLLDAWIRHVMNRQNFLAELKTAPVIAILRRPKVDVQVCIKLLVENGIRFIEMTMESEGVEDFLRSKKQFESDKVIFGAGTVTTLALAKKAIFAGAKFLVSPNFNPEVVRFARDHDLPICCGAMTPTEIFAAHAAGADAIKVFPAGTLGPQYFKELRGPFPDIPLIATGGISVSNASLYFQAGADAIGVGNALVPSENRDDLVQQCVETARKLLASR
jgi:2-dehydro-3-deoxyphosphogluconate aldolase/(4S)-4-hydroxy-2-oxoglutarate aldolase